MAFFGLNWLKLSNIMKNLVTGTAVLGVLLGALQATAHPYASGITNKSGHGLVGLE